MTDLRKAAQQALEALSDCIEKFYAMRSIGVIDALPLQAVSGAQAITALRAALAEAPAVKVDWQSIETAPKDGTAVLVSAGPFIHRVEWDEEFEWWAVDDNKLGPFRLRGSAPTHWMPLPAAPKGGA